MNSGLRGSLERNAMTNPSRRAAVYATTAKSAKTRSNTSPAPDFGQDS